MQRTPLISIVIANYNYGRFLEDAIQSVLAQDMGDQVELIICDAASTDNSVDIIKKYANGLPPSVSLSTYLTSNTLTTDKALVTWWCSEPDKGQSAAFNKGFAHATGKFLTWLNADDILLPGALRVVADAIRRNQGWSWFVGGTVSCNGQLLIKDIAIPHKLSWRRVGALDVTVGGPSSFFTRELLDSVGGIDENLHYSMDIDLWVKFVKWAKIRYKRVPCLVWGFRNHEASKTSGYTVAPESEVNKRRKDGLRAEYLKRHKRFGTPSYFMQMIQWWPVSIVDLILRILLLKRYKDTDARALTHSKMFYWLVRLRG